MCERLNSAHRAASFSADIDDRGEMAEYPVVKYTTDGNRILTNGEAISDDDAITRLLEAGVSMFSPI